MPATMPENDGSPDDIEPAALDEDARPETGAKPDTARDASRADPAKPDTARDASRAHPAGSAQRTVLEGPALENEEMRRGTEDLRSSEEKIAQAREFAHDLARQTEPAGGDAVGG